jgi:hypothetical protein
LDGDRGKIMPTDPLRFTPIQISDPMDLSKWERFS